MSGTVRFDRRLVRLFVEASGDDHPIHTSRPFSRLTPYGEPIVHGVLQGLAALAAVEQEPGWALRGVAFEFLGSAVPGVDYSLEVERLAEDRVRVRMQDGRLPLLVANVAFARAEEEAKGSAGDRPESAWTVRGAYRPDPEALAAVMAILGLDRSRISERHVAALMWASFLVGVEYPHERILLVGVKARFAAASRVVADTGFEGEAWLERAGERGDVAIEGRFGSGGRPFCALRVTAARLAEAPGVPSAARLREALEGSPALDGRVALVVGGSRGLGAALARGLALQGCRVFATHSRSEPAEAGVEWLRADARRHRDCERVARHVLDRAGRLDVLVVNAWPSIRPLSMDPGSAPRARRHLSAGLAIVTEAMMTLVPLLAPAGGWNVLISSAYVGAPRPYFSHYIAGKAASEALVRSAAVEHRTVRHLIVRPPKLRTHQTSSPLAGGAMEVETVAAAVVRRLSAGQRPGEVSMLEEFVQAAIPTFQEPS